MAMDDSGPAFPHAYEHLDGYGGRTPVVEQGMTLRDYFAGQALPSVLLCIQEVGLMVKHSQRTQRAIIDNKDGRVVGYTQHDPKHAGTGKYCNGTSPAVDYVKDMRRAARASYRIADAMIEERNRTITRAPAPQPPDAAPPSSERTAEG